MAVSFLWSSRPDIDCPVDNRHAWRFSWDRFRYWRWIDCGAIFGISKKNQNSRWRDHDSFFVGYTRHPSPCAGQSLQKQVSYFSQFFSLVSSKLRYRRDPPHGMADRLARYQGKTIIGMGNGKLRRYF